ncbi:cytochrome c biogenesis protein CcdA [Cyclobacterium sp.]|uniref:cytochrome c biogenesis CcdA family protein n=1 Tax=Cyclobacterium sp. TaxID=1966343 RepID=UPI0025C5F7BC|nr:cytochrome c biogenesis protein CcdA [Cyclobacterium sp.]
MDFVSFSFLQGIMAFLAPCAVALLPGYIMAYISRNAGIERSMVPKLLRGLKLAFFSISGILIVYALAGTLIILASQLLKENMKFITVGMGGLLVFLGLLMLFGKSISININFSEPSTKRETSEAFFFGIAYAIGALGCLFPLFLVVATQALAAENVLLGGSYLLAYFVGFALMMVLAIVLATFAQDLLRKYLRKILPYMERAAGFVLILSGIYIIYYQLVLF